MARQYLLQHLSSGHGYLAEIQGPGSMLSLAGLMAHLALLESVHQVIFEIFGTSTPLRTS